MLASRPDRLRNVLRLRGRHHEHHVIRRLFQRLQQRIEGRIGNLVRLVQNPDFVSIPRRAVARRFAQLANLVDPAIRRRVDLQHIHGVAHREFPGTSRTRRTAPASDAPASPPRSGSSAPAPESGRSSFSRCPDVPKKCSRARPAPAPAHSAACASRAPARPHRQNAGDDIFAREPGKPSNADCIAQTLGFTFLSSAVSAWVQTGPDPALVEKTVRV